MQSKSISGQADLTSFAKNTPVSANLMRVPKKLFASPQPHQDPSENPIDYNVTEISISSERVIKYPINLIIQDNCELFKNEIVEKGGSLQVRNISEELRREYNDLDVQIRQLQVNFEIEFKFIWNFIQLNLLKLS